VSAYCTCILYVHTVSACCTCILYLYTVRAYCVCMLYLHSVPVYCTCILCMHALPAFCTCMLYVHTVSACCTCILYLHTVPALLLHGCQFNLLSLLIIQTETDCKSGRLIPCSSTKRGLQWNVQQTDLGVCWVMLTWSIWRLLPDGNFLNKFTPNLFHCLVT
jgi:hypothetical protein